MYEGEPALDLGLGVELGTEGRAGTPNGGA
jgi:hypothetical protein